MRARGAVLVALGAAAGLLIWLVFAVGEREEAHEEIDDAPAAVEELDEDDPDLEPAPRLEVEELATPRTVESVEAVTPPQSASTSIPEPSPDAAIVHGLLRDAATGEALPEYALRIQGDSGPWEDVMTDENGLFATGSPITGTTIRVKPFDDPSHQRGISEIAVLRRVEDGEASDLDLKVPSGPTYRLAISPSNAVVPTTLSANLRIRNADDVKNLGPEPLRAGDPPWVRFAAADRDFDRCDRIEVCDKEGLWRGSANVSTLAGVVPGIVDIVLESRAALLGKVVDPEGRPVRGSRVVLDGVAASGKSYVHKATTAGNGEFRFDFLPAGSGVVTVSELRHVEENASIRLVPGAVTRQDFILSPSPPAGAIRGRVESETGRYGHDLGVEIALRPLSGGARAERLWVRWEEQGGRRIGEFAFEALPAGEYEVTMRTRDWFTWNPLTRVASPPSENLRFVVHDDLAHAEFAFRARDAGTGRGLDVFAWSTLAGDQPGSQEVRYDESFLFQFPLERGFRWRLDRRGYQPAFGDEKAFGVEELREGKLRKIAELDLTPGWGEVFRVVRRNNKKPIAGAKILLDGREAGTTKGDGTCHVEAREKPRSVEIDYRDWKVSSPVDMRPSWKRKEKRFVDIEIAPPAKN